MIKNNLKLHDTFLVSVEILSANAIIVSANINSIIYRGALIQCNKSDPFIFKNNKSTENCFSSKRLNVTEAKRSVRIKNFKSDYNLRRTNHKITKAKRIVCKSELKEATDNFTLNHINVLEPLSIKLKRFNGVYQNIDDLKKVSIEENNLKRKFNESDSENTPTEHKRNIIKIKKIKLHSDQYHYSISTDEISKDTNYLPQLFEHSESVPASFSPLHYNHIVNMPPLLSAATQPHNLFTSPVNFRTRSLSLESISDPVSSDISDFVPILSNPSDNIQPDSKNSFMQSDTAVVIEAEKSPCNGSITKLKIVKNSYNSYAIKSADKNYELGNGMSTRYNCKQFRKNDIIWAKLAGYSIWPAKVLDTDNDDHVIVLWLGNGQQTSRLHKMKLWDFGAHYHEKFNRKAKGHYLDAVEQARRDYGKLDFSDSCQWHVDISSESSTLESVNIDDSCYEFDRGSGPDLRTNVYLPVADEEFVLSRPSDSGRNRPSLQSFLVDSPDGLLSLPPVVTDLNI